MGTVSQEEMSGQFCQCCWVVLRMRTENYFWGVWHDGGPGWLQQEKCPWDGRDKNLSEVCWGKEMAGKESRPSKVMQIMEHLADNADFLRCLICKVRGLRWLLNINSFFPSQGNTWGKKRKGQSAKRIINCIAHSLHGVIIAWGSYQYHLHQIPI